MGINTDFDVCIIGSGAGGGPVAYTLAKAGHSVLVLEKGPWLREGDFFKDELACCRRSVYTPNLEDEQHVLEEQDPAGNWVATPTATSGWDFWNGNLVGGSTNLMSGFFHRLKPHDLRLRSEFGPQDGANVVDWPIDYAQLEPYYTLTEQLVGISGSFSPRMGAEPRSTADFPFPPTLEHPMAAWIDTACAELGCHALRVPRAILSHPAMGRRACEYSGYCGSYGCSSGAKGSARAALLDHAVATGNCAIRPKCKAQRLLSDNKGKITAVEYADHHGVTRRVDAKIYVIACQAIETCRLLLLSTGPAFPRGLANNNGQVGRNLIFSAGGSGVGDFIFADLSPERSTQIRLLGPFINRALDDWYVIEDPKFAPGRHKGGLIELLFAPSTPIATADAAKWDAAGRLVWGLKLKRRLEMQLTSYRSLQFEVFNDWLPTDACFVTIDPTVKDRWGVPVARVRLGYHPHDLKVGQFLAGQGERLLRHLGAKRVRSSISGAPPPNLQAGGCRFGTDPTQAVLDSNCQAHEVDNLYITDGSFMPTGGSVPYTWTIYANAFRVAAHLAKRLGTKAIT